MSDFASSSAASSPTPDSYPDPPFRYRLFDLGRLPDPPDGFRVGGKTPRVAIRDYILRKEMVDNLIDYHFWGIDPGVLQRATILSKVKLLYKLVYHQAPEHRPRHMGEMVYARMDAGPRLLSRTIKEPAPLPVSRFFPNLPSGSEPLDGDYSRPSDAAPDMPDSWLYRYGLPAKRRREEDEPAYRCSGSAARTAARAARRHPNAVDSPRYRIKDVVDAVEKAVLRFAYVDLERHCTATSLLARPHIIATNTEDLFKVVVGYFPAVSHVNVSFDPMADIWKFGHGAKTNIYRGRGPIGCKNSSALDCAIVVGRLLDAGSTIIDRKEYGWEQRFTEAEKAFIEATDLNWDVCSREVSIGQRDRLWEILGRTDPTIGIGKINPFWPIWTNCTGNFAQFQFRFAQSMTSCTCTGRGTTTEECTSSFVAVSLGHSEAPGATMQELVSSYFAPLSSSDCTICHDEKTTQKKRFSSLPLRMAVLCDDPEVKNHSSNLTFTYADHDGSELTAKYRWLGGVYYKNSHFRVVWTDIRRGEYDDGSLRFYDCTTNSGLIIGGIPPAHHDERVPGGWMGEKIIPLIIYERILDPDLGILSLAKRTIDDMAGFQAREQLILDAHNPWAKSEMATGGITQPWARILPEHGQRFHTVTKALLPGEQIDEPKSPSPCLPRRAQPAARMAYEHMDTVLLDPPLPQVSSPRERMSQALGSPTPRSRALMDMHDSAALRSHRSSSMRLDSDLLTNPESHLLSSSPVAANPPWFRSSCAQHPSCQPTMEDEAALGSGYSSKKRQGVRLERSTQRRKIIKIETKTAARKSSRLTGSKR